MKAEGIGDGLHRIVSARVGVGDRGVARSAVVGLGDIAGEIRRHRATLRRKPWGSGLAFDHFYMILMQFKTSYLSEESKSNVVNGQSGRADTGKTLGV